MRAIAQIRINGDAHPIFNGAEMLSWLLQVIDKQSPFVTLKENIIKAIDLTGELDSRKRKLGSYVQKLKTKDSLFEFCYNNILAQEGMPLLWGFSVAASIEKGASNYNPEKRRISTKHD